jgi:hypothetical protein
MPNAKRPSIPEEATRIPPAGNTFDNGQKHDNMAPFRPAPKKYEPGIVMAGESQPSTQGGKDSLVPEDGTGRG